MIQYLQNILRLYSKPTSYCHAPHPKYLNIYFSQKYYTKCYQKIA